MSSTPKRNIRSYLARWMAGILVLFALQTMTGWMQFMHVAKRYTGLPANDAIEQHYITAPYDNHPYVLVIVTDFLWILCFVAYVAILIALTLHIVLVAFRFFTGMPISTFFTR